MVAVSHRHHLLNTLARCNRLHLVRPSLTGDRLATAVSCGNSRAFSGLFGMAGTAGLELAASCLRRRRSITVRNSNVRNTSAFG